MENYYTEKDAKKKLKKYLLSGTKKQRVWALVLALLALAAFVMGIGFKKTDDKSTAKAFNTEYSQKGSYVYLDIVGISDWVYKYTYNSSTTTYYAAIDASGNFCMLSLNDSTYGKLVAQRRFWEDDNADPPEPYRVYGEVRNIGEYKDEFADAWEVSEDELERIVGTKYLAAGYSPAGERNIIWIMAGTVLAIFAFAVWLTRIYSVRSMQKSFKSLSGKGLLASAAAELEDPENIQIGKYALAGKNFFFGSNSGTVIPYSDILWSYGKVSRGTLSVVANTAELKDKVLFYPKKNDESAQALSIIAERNPDALIGFDFQKLKQYQDMCRQLKNK